MFLLLLLLSYFFLSYNTLYTFFFPHFTPKTMMDGLQTVTCRQSYKRCPSSPVTRIAHQTRTRRQIRNVLCCVYSSLRARSRVVCIPDVYIKKIIIMKILKKKKKHTPLLTVSWHAMYLYQSSCTCIGTWTCIILYCIIFIITTIMI